MVVSPFKLRILWTQYSEVPLEQVVLQWEVAMETSRWYNDIPLLYVQHFTSSGCVKYIGVGSFSSMASRMRRFTPGQKNRRFNTKFFELRNFFNGYHTRTSHIVFLLHLESSC